MSEAESFAGDNPAEFRKGEGHVLAQIYAIALERSTIVFGSLREKVIAHPLYRRYSSSDIQLAGLLAEIHVQNVVARTEPPSGWLSYSLHDLILQREPLAGLRLNKTGTVISPFEGNDRPGSYAEIDAGVILVEGSTQEGHRSQFPIAIEVKTSVNRDEVRAALRQGSMDKVLSPMKRLCQTDKGVYMLAAVKDGIDPNDEVIRNFRQRGGIYTVLPITRNELIKEVQPLVLL